MRFLISIFVILTGINIHAQITLDSCIYLARQNFPQYGQIKLLNEALDKQLWNISTNWLPTLNGTAQASYQSNVIDINILPPGFPTITPPPRDQYKFYLDASQLIFDGGTIRHQKNIVRSTTHVEEVKIEGEFFKLKEKIILTYFGILLINEQLSILNLTKNEISNSLKKAQIAYDAKTISAYQLNSILAEDIKFSQRQSELESQLTILIQTLQKICGRSIQSKDEFILPMELPSNVTNNRPELKLIQLQRALLKYQNKVFVSNSIPKVSGFAQVGYSNPALNFLKNEFQTYYVAGVRLNWNISSLYQRNSGNKITKLNLGITQLQEEALNYQLNIAQTQYEVDISKFRQLIRTDQDLILLQTKIREASLLQYDNGIKDWSDYLKDLHAEEQAKMKEVVHRISFIQATYLNSNLFGN